MIEIRNLTKSYVTGEFDLQILKGISFSINDGELCAIMGPSGSGKSTLMNILGCLDTPTGGEYLLDGENVATFDETRLAQVRNRKIGFVFQSFNLLKRTTALDNVALPLLYAGVEPRERHQRAVAALNAVGLGDRLDHKPNQLSGGQQQRVAIARSLVTTPSLILADEPTGNLDSKSSVEVMDIFQRLNLQLGITIMFVTHEPEIAEYTRRVLRIRDGYLGADEAIVEPRSAAAELAARTEVIPFPATVATAAQRGLRTED
ncbi:MAG: ABC transporter ATP-binding protein [Chloroflexota bacterium]|nr:ABC transporter ATP-binding protein [Chloroflexota bacterium]